MVLDQVWVDPQGDLMGIGKLHGIPLGELLEQGQYINVLACSTS